jgi:hypothetical protein
VIGVMTGDTAAAAVVTTGTTDTEEATEGTGMKAHQEQAIIPMAAITEEACAAMSVDTRRETIGTDDANRI